MIIMLYNTFFTARMFFFNNGVLLITASYSIQLFYICNSSKVKIFIK